MINLQRRILAATVCLALVLLSGCWDQKIYERIGLILQLGLELDDQGKLLYTASIPILEPGVQGKSEVLSTSKSLLRESREQLRLVSGKVVEGGKIQHIYFSKELAQKGINQFLEIFIRQTENPILCNVIVVDGSPKEMMNFAQKFQTKRRPSFYVNDLLVNTRQASYIPETRISDFTIMTYSKTLDPITPIFKYNENEIQVSGSALFKGDRMVGQINTAETGLLHALMGKQKKIQYMYHEENEQKDPLKIKEGIAISIKGIKRKVNITANDKAPVIDISLNCKASLEEYIQNSNLDNPEVKRNLEEVVAQAMEKDCLKLLKYLQETGSDPLGFGEMMRAKHNSFYKSVDWNEVYKEISFNLQIKLLFEFHGAIN